ncbi:hypothetical protein B0T17DRAFT_497251 [Bombardia bombarda]|uniref:Uncharacterized protein n=1 Tax=Bombardia bombarda TaxID=252184 RepID=A0AA40BWC5_9PEZI|nr:hypothetical protein B0T17DRAFT_497251 [Bombardia bombarda]
MYKQSTATCVPDEYLVPRWTGNLLFQWPCLAYVSVSLTCLLLSFGRSRIYVRTGPTGRPHQNERYSPGIALPYGRDKPTHWTRWRQKGAKSSKNTYNTRDSLVVTDPTTSLALTCLSRAERTGCRVLKWVWSYVIVFASSS